MADNPYAPPKSRVDDVADALPDGDFLPEGRPVPAGSGWRWIADAWEFTGRQRWMFIGVFVLYAVVLLLFNVVPFLGPIVGALLMPVISGGFLLGCDAVRRGEPLEVGHLFAGFQRHAGKLLALGGISFGIGVVMAIIMIAVLGVSFAGVLFGGAEPSPEQIGAMMMPLLLTVLVLVGLSVPLYMALWFAAPLIVFTDSDVFAALKTSFFACLKNVLPFLVWGVMVFIFMILASIPLLLGWLLFGPVLMASIYLGYRDIFHEV